MAVAVDAIGTEHYGSSSLATYAYTGLTTTAAANAIIVFLAVDNNVSTGFTVKWDTAGANQTMTLIGQVVDSTYSTVNIYGLISPSTFGNKTITCSWTTADVFKVFAASFSGADTSSFANAFANWTTATGTSTTPSVSVTSTANSIVAAFFAAGTPTPSISAVSGTSMFIDNNDVAHAASRTAGASSVTSTATMSSSAAWDAMGVSINAPGGSSATGTLALTEPADVVSVATVEVDHATLAATEAADTVTFGVTAGSPGTGSLAISELADVFAMAGIGRSSGVVSISEVSDAVLMTATAGASGGTYPGQSGNPVGYAATPANLVSGGVSYGNTAWPGSFTTTYSTAQTISASGSSPTSPLVISFTDFDAGTNGTTITGSNITFIGCRFQSNSTANYNVQNNGGQNIVFLYCSFTPRAALITAVPNAAWPAAGAGLAITVDSSNYASYCVPYASSYDYIVNCSQPGGSTSAGPLTMDHCDCWGFGNGIIVYSTTAQMTFNACWVHDPANNNSGTYHQDGIGYVNGAGAPTHVTINGCTIAGIANTNAVAFQASTTAYDHISVTNNYLSGFGFIVDMCHGQTNSTNLTFENNVFGTDIQWYFGPGVNGVIFGSSYPTNNWHNNTLNVLSGTTYASTSAVNFTSANNGNYVWPDESLNTTDWPLNSVGSATGTLALTENHDTVAGTGIANGFGTLALTELPDAVNLAATAGAGTATGTFAITEPADTILAAANAWTPGTWPGQTGNPVGYAATPANLVSGGVSYGNTAWPGSFTTSYSTAQTISASGASPTSPLVISFTDFDAGVGTTTISGNNITFIGCRFQSNVVGWANVQNLGANVVFLYCSFTPRAALHTAPPNAAWPSAGALVAVTVSTGNYASYCIPYADSYDYVMLTSNPGGGDAGPLLLEHCDCWGFGNGINLLTSTSQMTFSNCWVHDAANAGGVYHQDGIGYVNGAGAPANITITGCTIASIANTNGVAFQASTTAYNNITVVGNYLSGWGYTVDMCHNQTNSTNITFENNVFGSDIQWYYGPALPPVTIFGSTYTTNNWHNNTFKFIPGSTMSADSITFSSANNGNYIWPDNTLSTTDWPLNSGGLTSTGTMAVSESPDTVAMAGRAADFATTFAITEPADVVSMAGAATDQAPMAITEPADVVLLAGVAADKAPMAIAELADTVLFAGLAADQAPMAVVEPADVVALIGNLGGIAVASLAAIEPADAVLMAGVDSDQSVLAITETADAVAFVAIGEATSALAITETADAVALAGVLVGAGGLAITELPDAVSFLSSFTSSVGAITITELPDSLTGSGVEIDAGALAITEPADVVALAGVDFDQSVLAITELADAVALVGNGVAAGSFAASETPDTIAMASTTNVIGAFAASEAPDTAAFGGAGTTAGSFATSEAPDVFSYSGAILTGANVSIIEGADTVSATGNVVGTGSFATTEQADVLSASGYVADASGLSIIESPDTVSMAGVSLTTGYVLITEANDNVMFTSGVTQYGQFVASELPDNVVVFALRVPPCIIDPRHLLVAP